MTESNKNKAERELAEAQKWQTIINTVKDGINVFVEQGLWVTLSIDMAAISQRVYEKDDHFLYGQRFHLIKTLKALSSPDATDIGKGKIIMEIFNAGGVPNPMMYMFQFLRPLTGEMEKHGRDERGLYYERMDPIPTMILTFTVPGMFRMLGMQIGEIIPL